MNKLIKNLILFFSFIIMRCCFNQDAPVNPYVQVTSNKLINKWEKITENPKNILDYSIINMMVPFLGYYYLYKSLYYFFNQFSDNPNKKKSGFPWWKLGLATASVLVFPNPDFRKGRNIINFFSSKDSLINDTEKNFQYLKNRFDVNNPEEQKIIQSINFMHQKLDDMKKLNYKID